MLALGAAQKNACFEQHKGTTTSILCERDGVVFEPLWSRMQRHIPLAEENAKALTLREHFVERHQPP